MTKASNMLNVKSRSDYTHNQVNLQIIVDSLWEYKKHKNDAYAYFPGEIQAVRNLENNAERYIEFLLDLLNQKVKTTVR